MSALFTERILTALRAELKSAEFALKVREREVTSLRASIAELSTQIDRIIQRKGERTIDGN